MGYLESWRESGHFNKGGRLQLDFDLNKEQIMDLRNGKIVESSLYGSRFSITLNQNANLSCLTASDFIIECLGDDEVFKRFFLKTWLRTVEKVKRLL
jgi:hypothetical protein